MNYVDLDTARGMGGMRLVVVRGIPSPWSMAAKAFFDLKGIPYVMVGQRGNEANEDLVGWTRHRNAPVAVYEDECPRAHWLEILQLAERLVPEPALLPEAIEDRMAVVSLSHEICGERGLGWWGRQLMMAFMVEALGEDIARTPMFPQYGYSGENAAAAPGRVREILGVLSARLAARPAGSAPYFVGGRLTALDFYWAYFSLLVSNLPAEDNPMPDLVRQMWAAGGPAIGAVDPALIAHRDMMFEHHLPLPLSF